MSHEASIPNHPNQRDRTAAIKWARQRIERRDFVIFDCETTGLPRSRGKEHEIVRACIGDPDGKILFSSYVRPTGRKSMPADATAEHGITWKDVKDAPTIDALVREIERACESRIVISYNADFDIGMLRQSCEIAGVKPPRIYTECAMLMYSQFLGELNRNPKFKTLYKWQRQPGAETGQSSEQDIQLTIRCLHLMAEAEPYITLDQQFLAWLTDRVRNLFSSRKST